MLHADGTYAGGITFAQHCKNHYKTLEDYRKLMDKYTFIPEDCRQSIAEQVGQVWDGLHRGHDRAELVP